MELSKARHTFDVKEAVSYAWKTVKKNFKFSLITVIIFALVTWGYSYIQSQVVGDEQTRSSFQSVLDVMLGVIGAIIHLILAIGFIRVALAFLDGHKLQYAYLWDNWNRKIWNMFLAILLFLGIFIVGLVLLIIPGIIAFLKLQYLVYFIVDKDMGPIEALKASWRITDGNLGRLFVLAFVVMGIALLGLLGLAVLFYITGVFGEIGRTIIGLVGLIFVLVIDYPLIFVIHGYVYRKLSGGHVAEPRAISSDIPFTAKAS